MYKLFSSVNYLMERRPVPTIIVMMLPLVFAIIWAGIFHTIGISLIGIGIFLICISIRIFFDIADKVKYSSSESEDTKSRRFFTSGWFLRGRNQIINIESTNHGIIHVYGYDIKMYDFTERKSHYWKMKTSWFNFSLTGTRPVTKKEIEKYNIESLKAKIMLAT